MATYSYDVDSNGNIVGSDNTFIGTQPKLTNDGGHSTDIIKTEMNTQIAENTDSNYYSGIMHSHNVFKRNEIDLYNKTYRFGLFNPYGAISTTREFLFFTKPDLHIVKRDDDTGDIQNTLNSGLHDVPFWTELYANRKNTIAMLQSSYRYPNDPFNHFLQNQVISNLDVPALSAETIDTPTNMYGVGYSYRGSSEASDDNPEFSLEFRDSRWLDTYYFFKAYEEYETLKHHGVIRPWRKYIQEKIIHDQFSIYKFLVDEDMETIVYYGKMYGVMPKSLPRDVFSNPTFDNGLSYSIDFKAAFYEDMKPDIIADFNSLSKEYYASLPYNISVYNKVMDRTDNRAAKAAYIDKVKSNNSPTGFVYKLRWRGSDTV